MSTIQHREDATLPFLGNGETDDLTGRPIRDGLSDCRKKLRWLIGNPPQNLALPMVITPSMAQVMMERNKDDEWQNRPSSESGLRRYARSMLKGWKYTGETIIFSKSGRLLNGQHRLLACIQASVAFPCLVAFAVEDDAFKFMDSGLARTAGHIFAIEGILNYNFAAAVARIVYSYQSTTSWNGKTERYLESDELLEFYYRHTGIQDSHKYGRMLNSPDKANKAKSLMPQRWGGALHYICSRKSKSDADNFFAKIATGVGITSNRDVTYKIRNKLLANAGENPGNKEADVYIAAYTVKAWNAWRRGEKREYLRWRGNQAPNEPFPRAV